MHANAVSKDPQNAKMYKAQLEDFSDVMALRRRLGFARTFPYIQPEFDQFQLDLRLHDERVCMTALLALSARENAGNIRHPVYLGQLSPNVRVGTGPKP